MTSNPRYPHTIKITRATGTYDPFNPAAETLSTIYNGEGRNYKYGGTNPYNGVLTSDFCISIPLTNIEVKAGDRVEVTEVMRVIEGEVVDYYLGNLGVTVYWNKKNT